MLRCMMLLSIVSACCVANAQMVGQVVTTTYDPADPNDRIAIVNQGIAQCNVGSSGYGAYVNTNIARGNPGPRYSSTGGTAQCRVTSLIHYSYSAPSGPFHFELNGDIDSSASGSVAYLASGYIGANSFMDCAAGYVPDPSGATPSWGNEHYFSMGTSSFSWSLQNYYYSVLVDNEEHQMPDNTTWEGVEYSVVVWAKSEGSCGTSSQNNISCTSNMSHATTCLSHGD